MNLLVLLERAFCLSVEQARDESARVKVERPLTFTKGRTTLGLAVHPYNEKTEEGSLLYLETNLRLMWYNKYRARVKINDGIKQTNTFDI